MDHNLTATTHHCSTNTYSFSEHSNHTDCSQQTTVNISRKIMRDLKKEKQIGINKKITVTSAANPEKKLEEITQTYFSGLVYRLDSRSLSEINASGGFYPKENKENKEPLLAKNMCCILRDNKKNEIIGSNIHSWNQKGIISTSKNFAYFNVDCRWHDSFKYIIDSASDDNYGLDIDHTMQFPATCEAYEVVFEEPIKNECIIGYFDGFNHNNTFYPNSFYRGCFSWNNENVVVNYRSKLTSSCDLI